MLDMLTPLSRKIPSGDILLVLLILLLGVFLRFYKLSQIPPGLYPDVAANGISALDILDGRYLIYYPENGGREGLYFYYLALIMKTLGFNYHVLYVASALVGSLTLILIYYFAKRFWDRDVALFSLALASFSFYHLHFSRLGYRTILVPLFVLLPALTFDLTVRKKSYFWSALTGFLLGLGLYTYISYRLFLIMLVALILHLFLFNRNLFASIKKFLLVVLAFLVLTSLPLVHLSISNPGVLWQRSSDVFILSREDWPSALIRNSLLTLQAFNIKGDLEMQYNIPGMPIFPAGIGPFFILGIAICLLNLKRTRYFFLLLVVASFVLIVIFTDRTPHLLRALGMVSSIYIITSLGVVSSLRFASNYLPVFAKRTVVLLVALFLGIVLSYSAFNNYFRVWANLEDLSQREFYRHLVSLAEHMKKVETDSTIYYISNWYHDGTVEVDRYKPQTIDYVTLRKVVYRISWLGDLNPDEKGIYYVEMGDDPSIRKLQTLFPHGKISYRGEGFIVYTAK